MMIAVLIMMSAVFSEAAIDMTMGLDTVEKVEINYGNVDNEIVPGEMQGHFTSTGSAPLELSAGDHSYTMSGIRLLSVEFDPTLAYEVIVNYKDKTGGSRIIEVIPEVTIE